MDALQQKIHVTFKFPVIFTTGLFDPANRLLRDLVVTPPDPAPAEALVVVDAGVARTHPGLAAQIAAYADAHRDALHIAGPALVIPGGEAAKDGTTQSDVIVTAIEAAGLCRHSYVIAIGGGAVLDVVGYAAATAHRGIRLIRVATTVLAQDDSAVGVKNGVNAFGKKNFVGTFAPPFAVVNDFAFLPTLETRDWIGGVSEAIKAALIKDAAFFDEIERLAPRLVARDLEAMARIVRRSAELHCTHIANGGDPFELGSSRPLDFGHWAAHRLEQLTGHRLRHGEAVAIGLALDCTYAWLSGFLPEADWARILALLTALGLPTYAPELGAHLDDPGHPRSVLRGLAEFREHLGGRLTILLVRGAGQPFDVYEVDAKVMIRSIEVLRSRAS